MRISSIECETIVEDDQPEQRLVLRTDAGLSGASEVYPDTSYTAESAVTFLTDLLVGRDPFNAEALLADAKSPIDGTIADVGLVSAASAAMLDVARQDLGVSANQLMGGRVRDHVRACAVDWAGGATSADGLAAAAVRTVEAGYTALRVAPFVTRSHPAADLDTAVKLVCAVREAIPDEVDLVVTAERRLDVTTAVEFAARLHDVEPMWIEEPVAAWPLAPMREVSERTNAPLASGRAAAPGILRALIEHNIVAHLVLDVARVGGPIEARRIAALAEIYHIGIVPTASGGRLSARDALQFAAVLPNLSLVELRPGMVELDGGMVVLDSGGREAAETKEVVS